VDLLGVLGLGEVGPLVDALDSPDVEREEDLDERDLER
jgi:hypothetical protein